MPAVFALLPPPPPAAPPPVAWADPGVVEGLMEQAGLKPESVSDLGAALEFADLDIAVRAIMSGLARAIAHAGEERVKLTVEEALRFAVRNDGSVRLDNRFRLNLATPH